MADSQLPGPLGRAEVPSARTPGPLGRNDAADPDPPRGILGDTPGPLGRSDLAEPGFVSRKILVQMESTQGDPSEGIQAVIAALDQGRLHADMNNVKGQLRGIAKDGSWTDPSSHVLRASPELIRLLAGLLQQGATMTIMSLFRFKNGPHGEPQPDGSAIGRAVDIMEYGGFKIHLKNPENASTAISGVAAVMSHLPAGKYTLGLPRPGGGPLIDPEHDVFFPVTNHDQVSKSPGKGNLQKDLELLLEPARTALRAAIAGNPIARIQFMYPDGVDHIHVKAVS